MKRPLQEWGGGRFEGVLDNSGSSGNGEKRERGNTGKEGKGRRKSQNDLVIDKMWRHPCLRVP